MNKNYRRIVITGGHLTPALAVISELQKQGWQIIFIGRKFALEGESSLSVEYRTISRLGIPFICLTTGRLQRSLTRYTLVSLIKVPIGLIQSFYYLLKYRPVVILSFGGYLALPVALAGWSLRIPVVTHEQSVVPGLATKIISRIAYRVCVSWPQSLGFFPKEKTRLTGNPLRTEVFKINSRNLGRSIPGIEHGLPLIYITGGSLGAHAINEVVGQILPKILQKYRIIHQCGDSQTFNDYKKLSAVSCRLSVELRKRYYLTKYVKLEDVGWVLNNADLVVSRSGANIVTELAVLGKPAILIPLPWAGQQEQMANARLLEEAGTAIILPQEKLTGKTLLQCTRTMLQEIDKYRGRADEAKKLVKLEATDKLLTVISEVSQ